MKLWHCVAPLALLGLGLSFLSQAQGAEAPTAKRSLAIPVVLAADSSADGGGLQCMADCGIALPASGVAFSPDGKTLAVGGYREVLLWDLAEGKLAQRIGGGKLGTMVQAVLFSKDGKLLAAAEGTKGTDGGVKVFDVKTGQVAMDFQEPKGVIRCFALSADGKLLVAACGDGAAYVWSLPEKKLVATLKNHNLAVLSVSFGKKGEFLATGSADASIEVWDTATWNPGAEGKTYPGDVVCRCFLKSSSKARSGGESTGGWRHSFALILGSKQTKTIEVRGGDKTPGYARNKWVKTPLDSGMPLDFVSVQNKYYVACSDGTVKEFSPVKVVKKDTLALTATLRGHSDWVYAIALSADGKRLASASGDGTVKLWSTDDNRLLATLVQLVPGTDDWLIVAGQGYFAASNPAAVEWKTTNVKTSPEKLAGLQNPEMVKKSLAGEKTPAAKLQ